MPAVVENFSLGAPVEIGRIEKELKKLWAEGEGVMTRASLINLAVYSDQRGSLGRNTQLMSQLTEDHACRAIVIEADSTAKENIAEAWVSAHCHVSRAGSRQICSEQLSFRLGGPCTTLLPSIVFSHLDSDLPFYLWWQTDLPKKIDPYLWSWVDHLIYDSQTWPDHDEQMKLVETAKKEADQRIVLCDLNWTRLDKIRAAVAQFFDHPGAHHHFETIDDIGITHAPSYRSTAVLLAGWLAAQLNWKNGTADGSSIQFTTESNRRIAVKLQEAVGEPIGEIRLRSTGTEFAVKHPADADLLVVTRHDNTEQRMDQVMPAAKNDVVALLSDQLMRGGPHSVYSRVIEQVRHLI